MWWWYVILVAVPVLEGVVAFFIGRSYGFDKGYVAGQSDGSLLTGECACCGWTPGCGMDANSLIAAILAHHNGDDCTHTRCGGE